MFDCASVSVSNLEYAALMPRANLNKVALQIGFSSKQIEYALKEISQRYLIFG